MPKKNPPDYREVTVEMNGQVHKGRYVVENGVITVHAPNGNIYSTQVGSLRAYNLAQSILRDLMCK